MHRYELHHEAIEPPMSTTSKFPSMAALPCRTRFVLVNNRVPRTDANCALCCKKIEQGYVRELQTGLVYCNPQCFSGRGKMAFFAIEDRTRKAS
jgi:hypothetical protein